jgi:O-antigen biosynthesis protein
MMPLSPRRARNVRSIGERIYETLGDDPQFVFSLRLFHPRFAVFFLRSGDVSLNPTLYFDFGQGFTECDAVTLPYTGCSCYTIEFTSLSSISRLRFDPSSGPGRFEFWAAAAWSKGGVERITERVARDTLGLAFFEVHERTVQSARRHVLFRNVANHYAQVVQLGERTAAQSPRLNTEHGPFISFVVPVFNTLPRFLDDLLASFRAQPPGSSELVFCDDGSQAEGTRAWLEARANEDLIRVVRSRENRGIAAATNSGVSVARGKWIGFLDHDDALSRGTVDVVAQAERSRPEVQFMYTDEVVTDERLHPVNYHLKPAYDPVLLSGLNYINHLSCYRRNRLIEIGGMRAGFDGSQDYDLLLRYLRNLAPNEIIHVPYPAYLWRRSRQTFSALHLDTATTNARRALAEFYREDFNLVKIEEAITPTLHRVQFDISVDKLPRISVVIPNLNSHFLLSQILHGLRETNYPRVEIVVTDNGSTDPRVLELYRDATGGPIPFRYEIDPAPFNFSRQINRGIALSSGDLILLLNSDIEVREPNWLREMVSCFNFPQTGIVGARLLYPNGRLQHSGVIVGLGGLAGHWFIGKQNSFPGPMARLHVRQSLSAVTGACMLISRSCLDAVGPFDESALPIAYNDVDFCIRAIQSGFRVVWTPFATLVHHESATRGSDESAANRQRFQNDKATLRARHHTSTFEDRAFNPWYTRDRSEPTFILCDTLPNPR